MLEKFLNRRSVRNFTTYKLSEHDIAQITAIINSSPTSTNAQQFSAILITDEQIMQKIAQLIRQPYVGQGNGFILFVGDRTRMQYAKTGQEKWNDNFKMHEYTRVVMDATIGATLTHDALNQMGFGVTFIGSVINMGYEIEKILNLPPDALSLVGLVFGKPAKLNPVKPRMNRVYINSYDIQQAKKDFEKYNIKTKDYFMAIDQRSYAQSMALNNDPDSAYGKLFTNGGRYLNDKYKNFK